jgi:hypothetical protein
VRTIVLVFGEIRLQKIAAMMLISSRDVQAISRSAFATSARSRVRRLAPLPTSRPTSKRSASAVSRGSSRSITVMSCSSWSASTTVEPTWPAPMTTIFIGRAEG